MSTIRVTNIEHESTTDGGIQLDSAGHVTVDGQQMPTAGPLSGRRININGAMQVAQRGTVVNAGNEYGGPDRYKFAKNDGAYTISQDTDVPSGSGFASSFKVDVTSAASSTGNQYVILQHKMEGQDVQQFKKGTSSAKSFTLQFWIKSTKTGTYVVEFLDNDNSRHVCKTYTVSSSNTWEYKTITFPADTSGVLDNDNGASLQLNWWLYAGSTYTSGTLPTSWATFADANSAVGQVNAADSDSNNILFTGIQLEVGEKATPFEHKSYGDELARCERYFELIKAHGEGFMGYSWHPTSATIPIRFRTIKRDSPGTITLGTAGQTSGTISVLTSGGSYPTTTGSHQVNAKNSEGMRIYASGYSGLVDDGVCTLYSNGNSVIAKVDAEL